MKFLEVPLQVLKEIELLTYDSKQKAVEDFVNRKLKENFKMICDKEGHIGSLKRIAEIPDPEFEERAFGYTCARCGQIKLLEPIRRWWSEGR